jgi:hypothetical protein
MRTYYEVEDRNCEHEEYNYDILTGRATCAMCGFIWRVESTACDYPVCVGGECSYECERSDKHQQWLIGAS